MRKEGEVQGSSKIEKREVNYDGMGKVTSRASSSQDRGGDE